MQRSNATRVRTPWPMPEQARRQFDLLQDEGANARGRGTHAVWRLGLAAEAQYFFLFKYLEPELLDQLQAIRQEFDLSPLPDPSAPPYAVART